MPGRSVEPEKIKNEEVEFSPEPYSPPELEEQEIRRSYPPRNFSLSLVSDADAVATTWGAHSWSQKRLEADEKQREDDRVTAAEEAEKPVDEEGPKNEPKEEEPAPVIKPFLRIAMLSWETLCSIAVGGVAAHVTELAAGLQRRGHEVHVFTRQGAGQKPYEVIYGVHYHRCSFQLTPNFIEETSNMTNAFMWCMGEVEAYMNRPFDVVHCHDWLVAKGITQAKHKSRQAVLTMHSTEYGRCGNKWFSAGPSAAIRGIEGEGVFMADRVICVSGALCDEVKAQYKPGGDKVRCVYNGIQCQHFDVENEAGETKKKYGVGILDPCVLYVGRVTSQKGTDLLIEAIPWILKARSDAKFFVVGDGDMRQALERRCHEMGVASSVRWLGARSSNDPEIIRLFRSVDCVCMPSRNEPFGIVMLECWAARKPLVATRQGGPGELVWHDHDGYLVDINPSGISWGVCEVFKNFEHARWMGEQGRVKAAFNFNWDRIAEQTEGVYYEIAQPHYPDGYVPPPPEPAAEVKEEVKDAVKDTVDDLVSHIQEIKVA
mmetsp:Transcript_26299/g.43069  ORF Transcript_26299/g.43069 Transcript_26299/m.43069 type:complete len:545 (-) Transcript_26299:476-2110(-)|eukprot:CAMPEP_0184659092 /NCGR_PEP_ID=MMETSP0308-20130426/28160_1 /TAXON_ID=38269 /ORGANISM="Gloeochaete witrockiana, Strain SAG 46.84" /LENGTH=544 /DNA_ID=CAMNT_0027098615 /DNA_START=26 /DNA_END=1663 /DNA_ORIENTATION=-